MKYLQLFAVFCVVSAHFQHKHSVKNDYKESKNVFDSINITQTEVLIIGAGISGLEAARLLKQNGIQTLVIEARNRTGGRIWSIQSKNGHILDLGAAWLHGINGSIPHGFLSNPLWDLVQQAKIPTRSTTLHDLQIFNPVDQNIAGSLETWLDDYMDYVQESTKTLGGNQSLKQYADTFSSMRNFTGEQRVAFYSYLHTMIEANEAIELSKINAKLFVDITSVYYGVEPVFHDTGFHAVIDYIIKDFQDGDIRFEQIVNKISYGKDLVEVQTTNGYVYRAKYVLLTVPLGVLKGRQIEFDPPLPQWKLNAINRFGYGLMNKVILVWDTAWWNSEYYHFMRVASKPSPFGTCANANKWNNRPTLFCFSIGDEANRVETLTNQQAVEEVLNALQEMFPNQTIPMPIDSYVTRWKSDPFSNGSYSYMSQGQTYEDTIYMGEPIAHKILFAGEATSQGFYGYAHGALLSARREVTRLLYVYDLAGNQTKPISRSTVINPLKIMIIINVIFLKL
ncbi:unnamed protein product [Rotaria sordida]|uniref:Amine oxidase n=2 Tax=Rotaria sordida TaxID=392033 RepID=A0A814W3D8_9BILA|nr:unnamed protein product [Rotaria sordida]CAF4092786.1 unnamed protein product [Rotaria sordida]